jgi:hypothetical protein
LQPPLHFLEPPAAMAADIAAPFSAEGFRCFRFQLVSVYSAAAAAPFIFDAGQIAAASSHFFSSFAAFSFAFRFQLFDFQLSLIATPMPPLSSFRYAFQFSHFCRHIFTPNIGFASLIRRRHFAQRQAFAAISPPAFISSLLHLRNIFAIQSAR